MSVRPDRLEVIAPDGVGEVLAGDDLAALALRHCDLRDGDVLVVTSKVVSKAEGRMLPAADREGHIDAESRRVVARRGPMRIVENAFGMVQAAAGVDASNVPPGTIALLPADPDASARRLREALAEAGVDVAVVLTDTFGRAWRTGQTDQAIGAAGLEPLTDHAGDVDAHGHVLAVTAPAVADELAGAADLVKGKLGGRPFAVVRGLSSLVLAPGDHGPGATALRRPREQDMFALGAREAVMAALTGSDADCFGSPVSPEELCAALDLLGLTARVDGGAAVSVAPDVRVPGVAHAHGWRVLTETVEALRLGPRPAGQ